jgi:O-antigen/teichoic acid export membrane protein
VLSIRPGGIRQQLRLAARRFRIVLVLAGVYIAADAIIRVAFPEGWIAEYGPVAVAVVLAVAFLLLAQDPASPPPAKP